MTRSLLDTDLYKLTMQNAVRKLYPSAQATFRFTNRTPSMRFNQAAFDYIVGEVKDMDNIRLSPEEKEWLKRTCPYFEQEYLDWLSEFRLDSQKQVKLDFHKEESEFGSIDLTSTHRYFAEIYGE